MTCGSSCLGGLVKVDLLFDLPPLVFGLDTLFGFLELFG